MQRHSPSPVRVDDAEPLARSPLRPPAAGADGGRGLRRERGLGSERGQLLSRSKRVGESRVWRGTFPVLSELDQDGRPLSVGNLPVHFACKEDCFDLTAFKIFDSRALKTTGFFFVESRYLMFEITPKTIHWNTIY